MCEEKKSSKTIPRKKGNKKLRGITFNPVRQSLEAQP